MGWCVGGRPPIRLAVNLSNSQFHDSNLANTIACVLAETKFPAGFLDLELTETIVMTHPERSIETLQNLRALGVQLSLDDFGTGFSSLRQLQEYPLDTLKIDKSFVRDVAANERDASITRNVIAMAHSLGLRVLAEGVETQEQLDFLREHGCEEIQGYLLSHPLPPDQFLQFIAKHVATDAGRRFISFRRFAT